MTTYDPGDIVLVRFPFTDLSSAKQRPALVLSSSHYQKALGDVVVLALTSQRQRNNQLQLRDWKIAGLPKRTWCKPAIGTLASTIVIRRLGKLSPADYNAVKVALHSSIEAMFLP